MYRYENENTPAPKGWRGFCGARSPLRERDTSAGIHERGIGTEGHTGTFRLEICENSWSQGYEAAWGKAGYK
jgi:hypothetical protein